MHRVLIISHTYIPPSSRGKLRALAARGLEVTVGVPQRWRDLVLGRTLEIAWERQNGVEVFPLPARHSGDAATLKFRGRALHRLLRDKRPDLVQVEEEPTAPAARQVVRAARQLSLPAVLFTHQNVALPLPWLAGWRRTVVGDGPDRERLERLASDLRLAARVRWTGALPPEEVPKLWPELDVLVLPARGLPTWAEPAAHVVAEAMAHEVTVVGTSGGATPEVIGDAGVVVPGDDPLALSAALRRLAAAGDAASGNAPSGNAPSGNAPSGNAPSGNAPSGNAPSPMTRVLLVPDLPLERWPSMDRYAHRLHDWLESTDPGFEVRLAASIGDLTRDRANGRTSGGYPRWWAQDVDPTKLVLPGPL